jgi:hypothetical protein
MSGYRRRGPLWTAWRRLSVGERRAFLRLSLLVPAMAILLRLLGFRRTMRWLERQRGTCAIGTDASATTIEVELRARARARRYAPYRGNCLSQSLTLRQTLARRGIATDLVLGTNFDAGELEAHAWIEARGVVLNDRPDVRTRFVPLRSASAYKWN